MAMLEELGLSTCVQYLEGKKFMQLGSDQIGSYSSDIPSLSPLALIDLQRLIYKVRKKKGKKMKTTTTLSFIYHVIVFN